MCDHLPRRNKDRRIRGPLKFVSQLSVTIGKADKGLTGPVAVTPLNNIYSGKESKILLVKHQLRPARYEVGHSYFVLPAYNEEESLPHLLKRMASMQDKPPKGMTVFVVDDGSTDQTASIAREETPGLSIKLISHETNLGLGQAVQTGIKEVLNVASDSDMVVIMDADDTHDVTLLHPMMERMENGADIVIASRFVRGGSDRSAPIFRRLLSRGAAQVFNSFLPLNGKAHINGKIHDFTSGYRAYKVSLLKNASRHWGERLIEEQGFACMVELLLKLRYWSPVIEEVPMQLRYDRKLGASKLKLVRTIVQYLKLALRDRLSPPPRKL
jgi:dolichol-phosphate mannosyltransferase